MKKTALALAAAVLLALTACANGHQSSSGETGTTAVGTEPPAETTAVTAAETAPITEETVTEPPEPLLPPMSAPAEELSCFKDIDVGNPNQIVCGTKTAALNLISLGKDNKTISKICVADIVENKLITPEPVLIKYSETLVGVDDDGSFYTLDFLSESLNYYPADTFKPQKIAECPNAYSLKYDLSWQKFYEMGPDLCRIDKNGERSVIVSRSDITYVNSIDPSTNQALVSVDTPDLRMPHKISVVGAESGSRHYLLNESDDSVAGFTKSYVASNGYGMDGEDVYRKLTVYNKETGEQVGCYLLSDQYQLLNCYVGDYAVSTGSGAQDEKADVRIIRLSDGAVASVDTKNALFGSITFGSLEGSSRLICIFSESRENNTKPSLTAMMIDPEQLTFDGSLEKLKSNGSEEFVPHKCGAELTDARKRADEIEEKYGIRILLGDEVLDLDQQYTRYGYSSTEDKDSGITVEVVEDSLENIDLILDTFPEGFFESFKISEDGGGYCIALCGDLEPMSGESFQPGACSVKYGAWEIIMLPAQMSMGLDSTLYHETAHAIDSLVSLKTPFPQDEWSKLNPKDFEYQGDYDNYLDQNYKEEYTAELGSRDTAYFDSSYGMINYDEDLATLIARLLYERFMAPVGSYTEEEMFSNYPHIKAKLDFLGKRYESYFGSVFWNNMHHIKQAD